MPHKGILAVACALCVATASCDNSVQQSQVATHSESETEPKPLAPSTESESSATQVEPHLDGQQESKQVDRKDLTPEDAVRLFLVALATNDEEQLRSIALPMDGLEILLQGEGLSPEQKDEFLAEVGSLKLRRLALNETIYVPGGGNVTMDSDRVNEDRVQITFPDNPIPFDVLRAKNGLWWVNPEHVIAGRRAARAFEQPTNP